MSQHIDDWFISRRDEQLKAESFGAQQVKSVHSQQEAAQDKERASKIDTLFSANNLLNKNIKRDDYNFNAMLKEQGEIAAGNDSLVIPNKYRTPLKEEIAGFDIGTGRQERATYADREGIVRKAVDQLRTSSVNADGARPPEDSYPLAQIAYQNIKEGKGLDDFAKNVGSYERSQIEYAYTTAERAAQTEDYTAYVKSGAWNTKDNKAKALPVQFSASDIDQNPIWVNSARTFFERMYGAPKKELSDKEVSEQALWHMSQWNYNITTQGVYAGRITGSDDEELKKAFYNMMVFYDNIDLKGSKSEYIGRNVKSLISDPAMYFAGGVVAHAYRRGLKSRIGSRAFGPILIASLTSMPEGFFYGGFDSYNRQKVEQSVGKREEISAAEMLESGAEGAVFAAAATPIAGAGVYATKKAVQGAVTGTNAIINRMREVSKDHVFFPMGSSLRRQAGNINIFDEGMQAELFEIPQVVDPFYSKLENNIEKSIGKKGGTGEQLLQRVQSMARKGLFKPEELEWSGLEEILQRKGKDKITKDELLNELRKSNFKLNEIRLSGELDELEPIDLRYEFQEDTLTDREYWEHEVEHFYDNLEDYGFNENDLIESFLNDTPGAEMWEAKDYADNIRTQRAEEMAEEAYNENPLIEYYSSDYDITVRGNDEQGYYVLKGYSNRPHNQRHLQTFDDVNEYINENFLEEIQEARGGNTVPEGFDGPAKYAEYTLEGGENYREILFEAQGAKATTFGGGHFDEDDILVHARVQDFKLPNGEKSLFIDEIQSDWHNAGKQHGYVGAELDKKIEVAQTKIAQAKNDFVNSVYEDAESDYIKHAESISNEIASIVEAKPQGVYIPTKLYDMDDVKKVDMDILISDLNSFRTLRGNLTDSLLNNYGEFSRRLKNQKIIKENELFLSKSKNAVNAAPLKDNYPVTVLRRLIREAADDGYSSISWTPSDMQVRRWNEDTRKLYELVYDKKMVKEANRIGKKYGVEARKQKLDTGDEVWVLELPEALKYKAKHEGFPLFQLFGLGTAGALGAEQMQGDNNDTQL